MRTEDLQNLLVADLPSARPRFPRILLVRLLCGALLSAVLFFAAIGVRHDLAAALAGPRLWLKFAFVLSLLPASLVLTKRSAEPGAPYGSWGYALLAVPVLLTIGVALELMSTPASSWLVRLVGSNARYCLTLIPLLAAPTLACVLLALREGAPTSPRLSGAFAGLLAGATGAAFYATHCPDDSPLFLATWYPLAIAAVTFIGFLAGSRMLRW
jgi:hypothetical protein